MSPSIGHPTDLAVGTWTKVTGSRRPTSLLTNRVWFCCLLRPQIASIHFPPRVPPPPFARCGPVRNKMVTAVLHVLPLTIRSTHIPMIALLLRAFRDF